MRFSLSRTRLLITHTFFTAALLAAAAVCAYRLLFHAPDLLAAAALPGLVGAVILLPVFGQRILVLARARYEVTASGALHLALGRSREILPLEEIQEIRSGKGIPPEIRKAGPGWRTCWQGRTDTEQGLPIDWYATSRRAKLLLIVTRNRILAISPDQPASFANLVAELSSRGSLEKTEAESLRPGPIVADILADRTALFILSLGVVLITGLGSLLIALMPILPLDQPLKFDPSGAPTSAGDPARLLILPQAGGVIWLVNTVLGWRVWRNTDRPAAYLLWFFGLLVTIGLWVASAFLLLSR